MGADAWSISQLKGNTTDGDVGGAAGVSGVAFEGAGLEIGEGGRVTESLYAGPKTPVGVAGKGALLQGG